MKRIIILVLGIFCGSAVQAASLQLKATQDVPAFVYVDQTLNMQYELVNNNNVSVPYYFNINRAAPGITIDSGATCDMDSSGSNPGQLSPYESCTFSITMQTGDTSYHYNQQILQIVSFATIPLNYNFIIGPVGINMVTFGDSLSDMGNNGIATNDDPVLGQNTWAADVAAAVSSFQANPFIVSKNLNSGNPNNYNIDYAWGGARTYAWSDSSPSLLQQVQQYQTDLQNVQTEPMDDTVAFIWIGGNNFLSGEIGQPMNDIQSALTMLTSLGVNASNIYVLNLPDLGETPLARAEGLGPILSAATAVFNSTLATLIESNPGVHLVDIYDYSQDIYNNPAKYGFTNVTSDCVDDGVTDPGCPGYLFYNSVHPTAKTHSLLAEYVESYFPSK